jgi:hypothetical protein
MNIQRTSNWPSKYMKQTLAELRRDMQSSTVRLDNYNTPDSITDRTARCPRSKELKAQKQNKSVSSQAHTQP